MKSKSLGALCVGVLLVTSIFAGPRTSASVTSSPGQPQKPPLNYAYVVVTYSCGGGKNIAVYSQVFGACYQETNHSQIAGSQRDTFYQIAKAACGKDVVFSGQRTGYPYQGSIAEDRANEDRERDTRDMIRYGYNVETAWLQVPYYSRCGY